MSNEKKACHNAGRPGCLTDADEKYTMEFGEGEEPIYLCTKCGEEMKAINEAMAKTLESQNPKMKELAYALGEALFSDTMNKINSK